MPNNRTIDAGRLADTFKALSNPNRVEIFMRLASCCVPTGSAEDIDRATSCVGDLGRDLGIAPPTVSHHIKELHRAGLIQIERRGQRVECSIDPETLESLANFFARI